MVNDRTSDFLARIKNGYLARKKTVLSPCTKINKQIANLLLENKYLEKVEISQKNIGKKRKRSELILNLKYLGRKPAIENIIRISSPGKRVYVGSKEIAFVLNGYGISILSTSKGLLTDKEARKRKLGGEIICNIW